MASDSSPTMIRIQVTKRPKLSAATRPKLDALLFHSTADATPAPARPITPSGPMGIRSCGSRNASATMAAMAVAATQHIGTIAMNGPRFIVGPHERAREQGLEAGGWRLGSLVFAPEPPDASG